MPNFKCEFITPLSLNAEFNGVRFLRLFKSLDKELFLLLTSFENEEFFIQISKDFSKKLFLIKGEKHSKPSGVGFLQRGLITFKDNFCEKITNEALSLKPTRLIKQSAFIENEPKKLLKRLENESEILLEIGFGSGRHLLFQAEKNPKALVLGVEIYTPALEQVAKLAQTRGLNNILLTQNDARILFCVLENESIDKVFLHFPVPWLKQPLRRVLSKDFLNSLLRVLKMGAKFELRTDNKEYFDYALNLFLELEKCELRLFKNEDLSITSKYEARWKRQFKDIFDLKFIKTFKENKKLQSLDFKLLSLNEAELKNFRAKFKKEKIIEKDYFLSLESLYESVLELDFEEKQNLNKNLEKKINQNLNNHLSQENLKEKSKQDLKKDFSLLLKIAFGAFDSPEHCYILLNSHSSKFLFKTPFFTPLNIKALQKLNNLLKSLSAQV